MDLTPQQQEFVRYYLDPKSETYSNALQSALKANFKREYAESITSLMPNWLSEILGKHQRMLIKAEKRLESSLDSNDERIAQDTAKFIAKTIGKQIYSDRIEHTGADGKDLIVNIVKYEKTN